MQIRNANCFEKLPLLCSPTTVTRPLIARSSPGLASKSTCYPFFLRRLAVLFFSLHNANLIHEGKTSHPHRNCPSRFPKPSAFFIRSDNSVLPSIDIPPSISSEHVTLSKDALPARFHNERAISRGGLLPVDFDYLFNVGIWHKPAREEENDYLFCLACTVNIYTMNHLYY